MKSMFLALAMGAALLSGCATCNKSNASSCATYCCKDKCCAAQCAGKKCPCGKCGTMSGNTACQTKCKTS